MKLLDLLIESLTDIVYHFTYTSNLSEILKRDAIRFSVSLGSDADLRNRGKFNFLSVTRSKMSGYKKGNVKIVFDGRKLNQKYKSIPIDYWEYSKNEEDWLNKQQYIQSLKSLEQEDRILSDDTEIPNVSKYIKEIHIWDRLEKYTAISVYYAKQRNIPVYIYDNEKDFYKQTNPIQNLNYLDNPEFEDKEKSYQDIRFNYDLAAFIAFNSEENYNKIVNYLNDENEIEKFEKILKERTINYFKKKSLYIDELLISVKSDIHYMRTYKSESDDFLLNLLIKDMKKKKTKNLKDYLTIKQYYGKKTIKQIKTELINYLNNEIDNFLPEEYEYRLREWIEVDGEYYNHAYESPQLINYINKYILSLKKYINDEIEKSDDLKYNFNIIFSDNLKKYLDIENIKHNLNITDENSFIDIDKKVYDILYYLTNLVSSVYRKKSESLMIEYHQQFN